MALSNFPILLMGNAQADPKTLFEAGFRWKLVDQNGGHVGWASDKVDGLSVTMQPIKQESVNGN